MFAILDVETTGLSAKNEKITEIAIILHDGQKETDSYSTLINPERRIPYRITQITGINDAMVQNAPKFYEVAKKILKMTEGRILVGHNVRFDYNFLISEFSEFDYVFKRKTVCTVKTSRKLIPGQASYSLGKLTLSLGIPHGDKHRAMGDTKATAILFEKLLNLDPNIGGEAAIKLPEALSKAQIDKLPHKAGVYYFLNSDKEIIYVGKSIDIHKRVLQHLNNYSTKKSVKMMNMIADIDFVVTGSELVALLFESDEIKTLKPLFNRAQRRSIFNYGLFESIDANGYKNFEVDKVDGERSPITNFQSLNSGKEYLFQMVENYELCQKLSGLYKTDGACFEYQIHKCNGACIGEESPRDYNRKFDLAIESLSFQHDNFFILEKGPEPGFKSVVQVQDSIYQGIGVVEERLLGDIAELKNCIKPMKNNKDTQNIIRLYLRGNKCDIVVY
ncbi:MAG: DNA polymerase III subunit epsilon [Bacteroidetes bacterium 4572_112]|nr:MAG: DNA polymerase III subunit epsilon [Bacteroidetes bacterium 4572_112]